MLEAGWSVADITPDVGTDLSGFGGRSGPNEGIHDRLRAKALCLGDGATRAVVLTADLIGLDAATVDEIRQGARDRLGGDTPGIMVACSHTHSGPATPCLPFLGEPDGDYMARLTAALVQLVVDATETMAPARVGVGQAEACVGINRRERTDQGSIVLGHNPGGEHAPYLDMLKVERENDQAWLLSHAAHPVTLGGDNLLVSADWPGYAQRQTEAALGDGAVALFAQGCCGNINSEPRGTFEVAEAHGQAIADAVTASAPAIEMSDSVPVSVKSIVVDLPLEDPPSVDQAREILSQMEADLADHAEADGYGMGKTRRGLVAWAKRIAELSEAGATGLTLPFEIQAIRLGDTVIVGLPGEVFVEYQRQIKANSPFAHTFVFAYTNGNPGYVPTEAAFPQGGYEVTQAVRYYGTTMLTPECERLIVGAAGELVCSLK